MALFGLFRKKDDLGLGDDFSKGLGKDDLGLGLGNGQQQQFSNPEPDLGFQQPSMPSFEQQDQSKFNVVSRSNYGEDDRVRHEVASETTKKEFELISAKLDTLRVYLESLNQRISNLEKSLGEQKKDPWR